MRARRYNRGRPVLFVVVCALLVGALLVGAWLLAAALTFWAIRLVVR